ncbi:MAG: hypothetical protein V7704_05935 [Aurantimonas endophytica]
MTTIPIAFDHFVAFEVSKHELVVHILPADRQQVCRQHARRRTPPAQGRAAP